MSRAWGQKLIVIKKLVDSEIKLVCSELVDPNDCCATSHSCLMLIQCNPTYQEGRQSSGEWACDVEVWWRIFMAVVNRYVCAAQPIAV